MVIWFLLAALTIPLGLDLYMPVPDDNELTDEKIALGRRLFFDRRLSRDGSVACASCHDPIVDDVGVVPFEPQVVFQGDGDRRLVFDDQDSRHGKTSVNVLPRPGSLSTRIDPPWTSTMRLTRARPRPTPRMPARRASSPRTNC